MKLYLPHNQYIIITVRHICIHVHANTAVTKFSEHHYKANAPGPENERTMIFYHEARVDGLEKRVETSTEMTETFINREDFLYYRYVEFGKRAKKFGPAENSSHRPILVSGLCDHLSL